MNKFINKVYRGKCGNVIGVEYNDSLYAPVMESLYRSNTFFPGIARLLFSDNDRFLKIWFKDKTYVEVRCSKEDHPSKDAAIAFAIMKRLYGVPDETGKIVDANAGGHLRKLIKSAFVQDVNKKTEKKSDKKVETTKKESLIKKIAKKVKKSHKPLRDKNGRFCAK